MEEGSILVVCPAVLRYSWAEELERWLPSCLPADVHLGNVLCFKLVVCVMLCFVVLVNDQWWGYWSELRSETGKVLFLMRM